ncbi:MAG: hypothetical protein AB1586_15750 [Pseudomonadota bacterium]
MRKWFDFLIGAGATARTVPTPSSAMKAQCSGRGLSEQIRDILRLELEIAAECALKRGSLSAATRLRELAETTHSVDMAALHAYARLLDDLEQAEATSRELRQVGIGWFPENAADYVARLVSRRDVHAGPAAAADTRAAPGPTARSTSRSRP